jgi:hypothetical protein
MEKHIANTLQKCIQSGKYFNNGTIDFDGIAKEILQAIENYDNKKEPL